VDLALTMPSFGRSALGSPESDWLSGFPDGGLLPFFSGMDSLFF
jgi:hypothetical protein